jgi:hypothetical protein
MLLGVSCSSSRAWTAVGDSFSTDTSTRPQWMIERARCTDPVVRH